MCTKNGRRGERRATLRINVKLSAWKAELRLEGRLVGPWVAELARVWMELLPELGKRQLVVDLGDVTYADEDGVEVLHVMHTETRAAFKGIGIAARQVIEEVMRRAILPQLEERHVHD